jgi:hypothetical protein
MISDPEWNVVKAVFYYPVAHNLKIYPLPREYNRKKDQSATEIDVL